MELKIKEASHSQFHILLPLYFKFYSELRTRQGWKIHDIDYYKDDVKMILGKDKVFIAYDEETAIGFIRISKRDGAYWIEEIYVENGYRGLGVGKKLVKKGEDYIKNLEISAYVMVLPQDRDAIMFWCKMGYDMLNTIELVKDFRETNRQFRHRTVSIMGYSMKLARWRYEKYTEKELEYLDAVEEFYRLGGTREEYLEIVSKALRQHMHQG